MSMAVGGSGGGVNSTINMTPLIDVLLVLLIIFMVITPTVPKGMDTLVPQKPKDDQKKEIQDDRTVVVSVDKQHHLKINQDDVTEDQLAPRLTEIFKTRNERVIFVKGDPDALFSDVANVIDIAKGALIDKVGLITQNLEEGN